MSSAPASVCQTDFEACLSEASSVNTQQLDLGSSFLPNCEQAVAQCKVDVGQLSQCISDLGDALVALSNGVTVDTACARSTSSTSAFNPFAGVAIPASCTSLPSGCPIGSTSSSVSVSGSGG